MILPPVEAGLRVVRLSSVVPCLNRVAPQYNISS